MRNTCRQKEEREKFRDIAGYYEAMNKAYEKKLFDENIRSKWKMAWKNAQDDGIMYAKRHHYGSDQVFLQR